MKRVLLINILLASLFITASSTANAQSTHKVLFLGNSYTGTNNLPQIIYDVALSTGDTLIFDSYTPGGFQLIDHSSSPISQTKIMAGGWDYVVLQGQSQEAITNYSQFRSGAAALFSQIKQYNPCAVTMPYMTWGRKNGDASNCASFPVMCTYQGMDTTIRNRYLDLTAFLNGEVSPVSVVWNYLRQNHPTIELYQIDESHPSLAGSYAAACCFYASIFKKDPTLITFDAGLSAIDASNIRNTAKTQVFDKLNFWDFKKLPTSNFKYSIGSGVNEVMFMSINFGVHQTYLWDFGDNTTSTSANPTHSYLSDGTYTVSLTTTNCDLQGTHTSITDTIIQFCSHTPTITTNHPWLCENDTLWTQPASAYQWYVYGSPIPETKQYLSNFSQYNITGFSVMSTLNNCAELSEEYSKTPEWSGYYFDALGDPCTGDTVPFAVLHVNGFLSGSEIIHWYKNDTLLTALNNHDTLLITGPGTYLVNVINPNSICPLDTTWYSTQYNCGSVGFEEQKPDIFWNIFPNPGLDNVTIKFTNDIVDEQIQIYSALGRLVKVIEVSSTATQISIADLPSGLYYIRLNNKMQPALKFLKQ